MTNSQKIVTLFYLALAFTVADGLTTFLGFHYGAIEAGIAAKYLSQFMPITAACVLLKGLEILGITTFYLYSIDYRGNYGLIHNGSVILLPKIVTGVFSVNLVVIGLIATINNLIVTWSLI